MREGVLQGIENSRFLITGGLGFVGRAVAHRLLKEGAGQVILLAPSEKHFLFPLEGTEGTDRLQILKGDVRDKDAVEKAMRGCDYVFHESAIRVTRCEREPRLAHEILVDGTFNVALACLQHRIKKFIHASSAVVYGEPLYLPLDEEHPTRDTTFYGIFKAANENLLRSFKNHYGLDYLILRYFNVFGPGMNLFGEEIEVLIRWLDRLDAGLPPLVFGDGRQSLDWVHIDDAVEANWLALCSPESGEIFNVCTGRETSILELLELLLKVQRSSMQPEFREKRAVNQVSRRFGSPEKAKEGLGFRARTPLEKGLRELAAWREALLRSKGRRGSLVKSNG